MESSPSLSLPPGSHRPPPRADALSSLSQDSYLPGTSQGAGKNHSQSPTPFLKPFPSLIKQHITGVGAPLIPNRHSPTPRFIVEALPTQGLDSFPQKHCWPCFQGTHSLNSRRHLSPLLLSQLFLPSLPPKSLLLWSCLSQTNASLGCSIMRVWGDLSFP